MREIKKLAATMNWGIMRHWTSISEDGWTGGLSWQLAVYTHMGQERGLKKKFSITSIKLFGMEKVSGITEEIQN